MVGSPRSAEPSARRSARITFYTDVRRIACLIRTKRPNTALASMHRQKLPTVARTLLFIGLAMGVIAFFVWGLDVNFAGMGDDTKRRFGQSGLLFAYCGALLSAHSLFWDDAFAAARAEALAKVSTASSKKDLLERLHTAFPTVNFNQFASAVSDELRAANSVMAIATSQPKLRKVSGWGGIALIVLGTVFQIVGLG